MKKEEIHLGDIHRWLFGQTPPEFMIEVIIRTILIYLLLLLTVHLMGKRMTGQITLTELSVMVTLGAIVSPIMQLPDRGILFGVAALAVAVIFQRGINYLGFKNEKVEKIVQGEMSLLIKDGVFVMEEMKKTHLTQQEVFSMLREKKIQNMGKVKRAYLEACGILSVYEAEENKPGLPVFPATDPAIKSIQHEIADHVMACCNCGHVQQIEGNAECEICNAEEWSKAYLQTS
ncbi:MAG TPA: YetF domain-containing protein [Segetibacter sp.]|jgi:uncharacterized membrane protein YcaP (DUF421 family)